jgi:hypothetical protein
VGARAARGQGGFDDRRLGLILQPHQFGLISSEHHGISKVLGDTWTRHAASVPRRKRMIGSPRPVTLDRSSTPPSELD